MLEVCKAWQETRQPLLWVSAGVVPVYCSVHQLIRVCACLYPTEEATGTDNTQIIAAAVGAGAGVLVLIVIGGAIGIFFLCFYYPHR